MSNTPFVTGAVRFLRYGLWWQIIGHSRSLRTALGPLVGDYRTLWCSWCSARVSHFACFGTLVQYGFCVKVSGGRLSDIVAVVVLRACLKTSGIRPSCRLRTARGPLVGDYRTFTQLAFCARVGR